MPTGSETAHFISKDKIPKGKFAAYARTMCKIRPQKAEIHRMQIKVEGNLIKYLHNFIMPTLEISTVKCLINGFISASNTKFCGADTKDIYLNTTVDTFEYMRIKASFILVKNYETIPPCR